MCFPVSILVDTLSSACCNIDQVGPAELHAITMLSNLLGSHLIYQTSFVNGVQVLVCTELAEEGETNDANMLEDVAMRLSRACPAGR